MKKQLLIGMASSSLLFADPALSLPFDANPGSFEKWLSTQSWRDNKKRYFSNFANCKKTFGSNGQEWYECAVGYVKIVSPLGSLFCELVPRDSGIAAMYERQSSGYVRLQIADASNCSKR